MKTAQHDCDAIICVCVLIYVFLSFSRSLLLLLTQNCFMAARQTFFKRRQLKFKPSPKDTHTHNAPQFSPHPIRVKKPYPEIHMELENTFNIMCSLLKNAATFLTNADKQISKCIKYPPVAWFRRLRIFRMGDIPDGKYN